MAALPAAARPPLPILKDAADLERAMAAIADDEKAHDGECRSLEELLPEYRGAREAARREELWARYGAVLDRANMLCDREQQYIDAVNIGALSRMLKPGPEAVAFAEAANRLIPLEAEHSRLCHLNDKFITDFKAERDSRAAAPPPAAPKPAQGPVVIPDEESLARAMDGLSEDKAALADDCSRMTALVAEFRAAATAPPTQALERRGALAARIGPLIEDADERCGRHWRTIDAVKLAAFSRSMGPHDKAVPFAEAVKALPPLAGELERLCRLKEKLKGEYFPEKVDGDAALSQALAPKPFRGARGAATAAGAAALAAAGAAWAFRRRSAPALPAPSGDFTVGRLLGRGSLGETYEGFDNTLRRRVALKRLRPELLAVPDDAQRLAAGARAAAAFGHAGLVALHTLARQGGHAYLVFEYVDGPSLAALLARTGTLGFAPALKALAPVAEGLEAAHAAGLVHGDVRPSDILVAQDGSAKLKGLGFAAVARGTLARVSSLEVPGRFDYMAPEREIGAPDASSDTYALAACFYRMLTGRPPFAGADALADKRAGRFAAPRTLAPALPAGMDLFFKTALAADPAARFASPRALSSAAGALR
ncbi:serine/threonine protein kinase [bacterium]|nr:MAG: serine/threonine protein kinase [bacterium]